MRETVACVCMEMRESKISHSLDPSPVQMKDISRMGLLSDTSNCGLRMRQECWELFFPQPQVSDPDMHHGRSRRASRHVRHVPAVMNAGITNKRFPLKWVARKTFQAFPAHAQPAILGIW